MTNLGANNPGVFLPEACPYGVSYAKWTAKWWQWALSISAEHNPVNDTTGKSSSVHQSGPVWFLAGTLGGVASRRCTIPLGKAILFPILNHGGTLADSPNVNSEQELLTFAIKEMDIISDLEVRIDGVKLTGLERYRVRSPIFDVVLPQNNLFGGTPGLTRGASDGYWLFLEPLLVGDHKIHSFGSCNLGKVSIGVDYDIQISQ
jgi:hypothetical protein